MNYCGDGNLDNPKVHGEGLRSSTLSFQQAAAQGDTGQVHPAVLFVFANESQFTYRDRTAADKLRPAIARHNIGLLRQFLRAEFHNREVRHVWPFLFRHKHACVQLIMQFAHAIGGMGYTDKHSCGHRYKSFHITESDFEPLGPVADFLESLKCRKFASLQLAGREYGQMSGQMRQIGMQLLPEIFHKFPDSISHIGH